MNTKNKILSAALALAVMTGAAGIANAESTGQYIDDASITTKVKAQLVGDKGLKSNDISVETNQGIVKLTGTVATKSAETMAVHDANQVNGVKSVSDFIQVSSNDTNQ